MRSRETDYGKGDANRSDFKKFQDGYDKINFEKDLATKKSSILSTGNPKSIHPPRLRKDLQ
jgi:hypothetical protein